MATLSKALHQISITLFPVDLGKRSAEREHVPSEELLESFFLRLAGDQIGACLHIFFVFFSF